MRPHYLNSLFAPRSIAMFGASEKKESVGGVVYKNIIESKFKGDVFPVNPKHKTMLGKKCYKSIADIHEDIDLAVVATPSKTLPAIVEACGEKGVRAMVIHSAGFREAGPAGIRLEERVMEIAHSYGIRVLGPNSLGFTRSDQDLNVTFGNNNIMSGNLALISQSGAVCTAVMDWAEDNHIGFSTVVSMGTSGDVDFGDVLDYLVTDPKTTSILLYIEGLHNSRRFMSGLRAAARIKPVIAIKVGRHHEGAEASMSHTGALVGNDDVFSAALARSGVVRIKSINQLCAGARTLASRYRGCGNRIAIVTNGGGPGILAADHLSDDGLILASLSDETKAELDKVLPVTWSHGNPVDIIGDATPERYSKAVELCLQDENVDGVEVILTPQAMTNPKGVADDLIEIAKKSKKPIITSWMGGSQVASSRKAFLEAGIPSFPTPETAIDGFRFLSAYKSNQQQLVQAPTKSSGHLQKPDVDAARLIIESALADKRKTLNETESSAILEAFHISSVRNSVAHSPEEALVNATSIGFPVALKILSPEIAHKTDVGGVRLNINNAHDVRGAYRDLIEQVRESQPDARIDGVVIEKMYQGHSGRELMIGIVNDIVFGPVISFGSGGTMVEVMRDSSVALPPLNRVLAENLISRTKVAKMLGSFRHLPPVNMDALIDVLLRVSSMACYLPYLKEMDINPLVIDDKGALALDAHIVVDYPKPSNDPYNHMAIHPYPTRWVEDVQLPDGTDITIRPIRPDDAAIETAFIDNLSKESKYFRFMQNLHHLTPEMLTRFTQIDYDQEMALIAVTREEGQEQELGVCRYVINPDTVSCEFALVVSDDRQRQGLGHRLMQQLMRVARDRGLKVIEGEVLTSNRKMLGLMKSLGFSVNVDPDDRTLQQVSKEL